MKIAIIINTTWNVYNFRMGIVQKLLKDGHEVIAITPADNFVQQITDWGVRHVPITIDGSGVNPVNDLAYLRSLKRILKAEKPHIILAYTIKPNIYGSIAADQLNIPIICNVSGLGTTFLWKGWVKWVATKLYNYAFKKSSFVFFQNPDDLELFRELVSLPKSKIGLLPGSGIDIEFFKCEPPSFIQPLKFLMISRLIIEKGVIEYLDAAESIKRENPLVSFRLVGSYDPNHARTISESQYDRLVNSAAVKYEGEVLDVKSTIANSDVIVLPSYREGTPRTLLEGASMSRPLIATDVPGCREVVTPNSNGFFCQKESATSLVEAFRKTINLSIDQLADMSRNSRKITEEKFDEKLVVNAYLNKINELVA